VTHDEQKSLRCMRSYGCVRVSLPLRPDDRVRCSMLSGSSGQKFFNDFSELVLISIYAKSLKSLANLAETVQTDPVSRPFGPSNVARGFPVGVFLLFGRTKRSDLHRNSPPAFFAAFRWQLGARCSLDRCDNSRAAGVRLGRSFRPMRFGLLILLLQVLPRIKTQTDFI
jgi:hypothetical protein